MRWISPVGRIVMLMSSFYVDWLMPGLWPSRFLAMSFTFSWAWTCFLLCLGEVCVGGQPSTDLSMVSWLAENRPFDVL